MELGNGGNKAQAQAVAGSAATPFQPIKALEDVLKFTGGNSRPVVCDRNDGNTIALGDLHGHLAAFAPMFNGVVDEIGHRIEQEISVAGNEDALMPNGTEVSALVFRSGIKELHDLPCDLGEIYRAERGFSITRLDLRDARE